MLLFVLPFLLVSFISLQAMQPEISGTEYSFEELISLSNQEVVNGTHVHADTIKKKLDDGSIKLPEKGAPDYTPFWMITTLDILSAGNQELAAVLTEYKNKQSK